MKLQFKHPPVQSEAVTAVCAVFNGQPMRTTTYHLGVGDVTNIQQCMDMTDTGFRNHPPVSVPGLAWVRIRATCTPSSAGAV